MNDIDKAIVEAWNPQPLLNIAYTQELGRILVSVRNSTGVELSFHELWNRLVDLKESCEIFCPEFRAKDKDQ